jgi:hypothetical protein
MRIGLLRDGRCIPSGTSGFTTKDRGTLYTPMTYAIACISFDLVVAAYIAIAYGLIGGDLVNRWEEVAGRA